MITISFLKSEEDLTSLPRLSAKYSISAPLKVTDQGVGQIRFCFIHRICSEHPNLDRYEIC